MSDPRPVPIREVVSALLVNNEGKLLLQLRDDRPDLKYPTQWTPFGGQVEPGEMPDAAIRREVMEELGIDVPLILWKEFEDPDRTIPGEIICLHYSYYGRYDADPATMPIYEGQRGGYFTGDEIERLEVAFGQKPLLLEFCERFARGEFPL